MKFDEAIKLMDHNNKQDTNQETFEGVVYAK